MGLGAGRSDDRTSQVTHGDNRHGPYDILIHGRFLVGETQNSQSQAGRQEEGFWTPPCLRSQKKGGMETKIKERDWYVYVCDRT